MIKHFFTVVNYEAHTFTSQLHVKATLTLKNVGEQQTGLVVKLFCQHVKCSPFHTTPQKSNLQPEFGFDITSLNKAIFLLKADSFYTKPR